MKKYLELIKPKIILGNLFSFSGGFFLSSKIKINFYLYFLALIGTALIIASGCVFNNYIDRDIDKFMERTKNRVLVLKSINLKICLSYGIFLGIFGILILYLNTNPLTTFLASFGFFTYVYLYSLILKRRSINSIIVGSLSGSIPPLIGYCANSNKFNFESLILFLIFILWQIPHSYSILIFKIKDYKNAKIPTLPVIKGIFITKIHILIYILAFSILTNFLAVFNYVNYKYFFIINILNLYWLGFSISGFKKKTTNYGLRKYLLFQ